MTAARARRPRLLPLVAAAMALAMTASLVTAAWAPAVASAPALQQIAAGRGHLVGLTSSGAVYTWGGNELGQLGFGRETVYEPAPRPVPGLPAIVGISAGEYQTLAWDAQGNVYGWGVNDFGSLGVEGDLVWTPTRIPGLPAISSASTGLWGSVFLDTSRRVWATGTPARCGGEPPSPAPRLVPGLPEVAQIAYAGHALARTADGRVFAWGHNGGGQLGLGDTDDRPCPHAVPGLADVALVATSDGSRSYAVTTAGQLYAWGSTSEGYPLGVPGDGRTPVIVPGVSDVRSVSGDGYATYATTTAGTTYAWGNRPDGQYPVMWSLQTYQGPGDLVQIAGSRIFTTGLRATGETVTLNVRHGTWSTYPVRIPGRPVASEIQNPTVSGGWVKTSMGWYLKYSANLSVKTDDTVAALVEYSVSTDTGKVLDADTTHSQGSMWTAPSGGTFTGKCGALGDGSRPREIILTVRADRAVPVTLRAPLDVSTCPPDELDEQQDKPQVQGESPRIKGKVRVGRTVRAASGTWTSGAALKLVWRVKGVKVGTGRTYRIKRKDAGKPLTVTVKGTKAGHRPLTLRSKAIRVKRAGS